jgi:CheY-like chemotaxis protein
MDRHLEPASSPMRVNGRRLPSDYDPQSGRVAMSTDGLEQSPPPTREPGAFPGPPSRGRHRARRRASTYGRASRERDTSKGGAALALLAPVDHFPRLVIADDDPVVRLVLGAALSREFEIVGVAGDGEEAIELARASQPDAALVDVVMPKGGGLRAVLGIHEVAPDTAIVMLSGHQLDGVVNELIQAGAIAYRRKGASPDALAKTLTESMKVHAAERRESAWAILAWYCRGLDRRSRPPIRP